MSNPFITAITKPTKEEPVVEKKKVRESSDTIQTSFRTLVENHRKLRELAVRDGVTMNDIINDALRMYCDSRGVRLKMPHSS
ncbi:hypothetical protein [Malikia granosa]|jgi:hypothetical protein|uniref:Uncharacterized protein n=1 Tax=Malikia granosa TaxID=263067 RepID=A0A2S9K302_9BURK|nr:hypothetical protein [Malikia granosa]PRD64850.1 hypothetical protein C6P64_12390 [Malikia granosa]